MIKIGFVGTGDVVGIAHYHALGLMKDKRAEIAAVYSIDKPGAEKWVREHGLNAVVCDSYDELLERVDGVNICVPNAFHKEYALGAIQAGKHFLVEKPMAIGIDDCRIMAAEAAKFDKCNMIGMVYRYSDTVQLARKIAKESLGQIYSVSAWLGGKRLSNPQIPMEWRFYRSLSGSGALGDFGSHVIDMADYVAGERYSTVSCMTETVISQRMGRQGREQVENDDVSVVCARSAHGLGSFTFSRVGMDDAMLMITGEGGMLQLSMRQPENVTYWVKKPDGGFTGEVKTFRPADQLPFEGWFDKEMQAYIDAICGQQEEKPMLDQGLYIEEVLHAAQLASATGKEIKVAYKG